MKKIKFIVLSLLLINSISVFAQLKLNSEGTVLVHSSGTTADNYDLKSGITARNSKEIGIRAFKEGSTTNWSYAMYGHTNILSGKFCVGVYGNADLSNTTLGSGRAFGVIGNAGKATSGYNYGVLGTLNDTGYGAGVCGTVNQSALGGYIPGRYAGYFVGNILATGTISGTLIGSSDIRLKENIKEINPQRALTNILKMTPIEYNFKQTYNEVKSDTGIVQQKLFDEVSETFQKKHYGLSAQELKEIYPDLVYEQDNGYLAINYTGLIPILIQSIKELKEEIDNLKEENRSLQRKAEITETSSIITNKVATLYQNSPNPFSGTTQIKYYIPDGAKTSYIYIYDLQGKQIKQYNISSTGEGNLEIFGNELNAGIYIYALIVDGLEIDVKRMILTD